MKRFGPIARAAALMLALYALQFLVFPAIFPNYFRVTNEAVVLYWSSFAVIALLGVISGTRKIAAWLPGNVLYLICLMIYSAEGAYNVQLESHYRLKWYILMLCIYMLELVLFELFVIFLVWVIGKIIKRFR